MENQIVQLEKVDIFQNRFLVLNDVNLSIRAGEYCYLIGKTGSGKTSLLKTLYAALPLQTGQGNVAGYDLKKLKKKQIPLLRRKLGMIFQDFNLLDDRNVEDNLVYVLKATGWKKKSDMNARIDEVLNSVGLPFVRHKRIHELSGGEQQRVAIARSILNNPELLIADEPTGNLDPDTSNSIVSLLKSLCDSGTAVLFATHDYRIIEQFKGRILKCVNGMISEQLVDN